MTHTCKWTPEHEQKDCPEVAQCVSKATHTENTKEKLTVDVQIPFTVGFIRRHIDSEENAELVISKINEALDTYAEARVREEMQKVKTLVGEITYFATGLPHDPLISRDSVLNLLTPKDTK